VLIAEPDAPTRAGLRLLLNRSGFAVAAEASGADAAVEAAVDRRIELVLLAADLPGGGIDAARRISARLPFGRVVVFTEKPTAEELVAAVEAGAVGYLGKDVAADRLPRVLMALLEGEVAFPRRHTGHLIDALRGQAARRALVVSRTGARLSAREWEVLELLAADASTAEIAQRLAISQVTVRRHVSSLLAKLGAADRAGAVAMLRQRSVG
jgi:DNA-binding NarL/FixJ family response regulator